MWVDIHMREKTTKPSRRDVKIKPKPPHWWDAYVDRRTQHHTEIRKYDLHGTKSGWGYIPRTVLLAGQVTPEAQLIKSTSKTQTQKLNRQVDYSLRTFGISSPNHTLRPISDGNNESDFDGMVTLSLGRGYYAKLQPNVDVWYQQEQLLRLIDTSVYLHKRKQAILCRDSACRALGVKLLFQNSQVDLLHGHKTDYRASSIQVKGTIRETVKVYKHKQPPLVDTASVEGVTVTSALGTLLDVLAYASSPDYVVSGDQLLRKILGLESYDRDVPHWRWDRFRSEFEKLLESRKRHCDRRLVERRLRTLSPLSESPLESLSRFMLHEAGLKYPECQYPIWYSRTDGRILDNLTEDNYYDAATLFIDMAWPQFGLAVEIDGISKYSGAGSIREEKDRENLVRLQFPRLLRLTSKSLENWDSFVALVSATLRN